MLLLALYSNLFLTALKLSLKALEVKSLFSGFLYNSFSLFNLWVMNGSVYQSL